MAYEFDIGSQLVAALVTLLVTALFIYFAAKFVLGRSSLLAAIGTAFLGTLLASIGVGLLSKVVTLPEWGFYAIGIAIWSLVAAIFFRARWIQGAIIGLVAWVLFVIVDLVIKALFG